MGNKNKTQDMKFLALVATAAAVTLSRRKHGHHEELAEGPMDDHIERMAEGLIAHCDKGDKDGQLTKAEAIACGCPASEADKIFGAGGADVNGDGKLSKAEIEGYIKEEMKKHAPPALAQGHVDDF